MNTFKSLWRKLAGSKKYREEFVAAQVKRGIPFQIRSLMKQKKFSQEKLAAQAGLTQGVVSRAANPDYGNLTLNTIIRIAAGFDVAFVGRFVPFSELAKWYCNLSEDAVIPNFDDEEKGISQAIGLGQAGVSSSAVHRDSAEPVRSDAGKRDNHSRNVKRAHVSQCSECGALNRCHQKWCKKLNSA